MKPALTLFQQYKNMTARILAIGATIALSFGVWLAFFNSPIDYLQKETVRIMYVHVPAAWLGTGIYAFMAMCGIGFYVTRHLLLLLVSKAATSVGLMFTLICLATGSLWGKPMWGTWWVWDARLTSVAVLACLYIGYLVTIRAFRDEDEGLRMGAIVLMIGLINLPIIKWSVTWWQTLHQPASVFRLGGPTIHATMLFPLFMMFIGFLCLAGWLIIRRTEHEIWRRRLNIARQLKHRQILYAQEKGVTSHAA